jgi:hypothetical protein
MNKKNNINWLRGDGGGMAILKGKKIGNGPHLRSVPATNHHQNTAKLLYLEIPVFV